MFWGLRGVGRRVQGFGVSGFRGLGFRIPLTAGAFLRSSVRTRLDGVRLPGSPQRTQYPLIKE